MSKRQRKAKKIENKASKLIWIYRLESKESIQIEENDLQEWSDKGWARGWIVK
jgi:hypothetical protein